MHLVVKKSIGSANRKPVLERSKFADTKKQAIKQKFEENRSTLTWKELSFTL